MFLLLHVKQSSAAPPAGALLLRFRTAAVSFAGIAWGAVIEAVMIVVWRRAVVLGAGELV